MGSKAKYVAIGVGIALAIGIVIAFALSGMQGSTSENPTSSGSRTVFWIHVHGLGIDPSDSSILYIATHGDFYQSVSGGPPVKVDKQRADYMAFNAPQAEGVPLYASGHPATGGNTGLIRSTEGGQTWEVVATILDPPVDFHAMAVSKNDPNIIIGFDSGGRGLFRTEDAGKTWEKLEYPGEYVSALAISPTDSGMVFAGTDSGIFQSSDGGTSWTRLKEYSGITVLALTFDADGTLYVSTETFGIARSSDLGKTWESIERPPNSLTTTSIAVDLENEIIYVAGFASPQGYQEVFSGNLDGSNWKLIGTNK